MQYFTWTAKPVCEAQDKLLILDPVKKFRSIDERYSFFVIKIPLKIYGL